MNKDITGYNQRQTNQNRPICDKLCQLIDTGLPMAESKIWHGSPVWFINGNPVAGYSVLKDCVRLLFWSGQSFNEAELKSEGSFKAAEVRYTSAEQISDQDLLRWLGKAQTVQWDYKNIVKRKGVLKRLT